MRSSYTLDTPLEAELMDGPSLALSDTEQALTDLDRVNKALFGYRASSRTLVPRISKGPRCQVLIDLGTGSGRVSCRIKELALRQGVSLRVIGVDRKLSHLLYGRRSSTPQLRVVADAEVLPFRTTAADWSFSNLLFHHFAVDKNRRILTEMQRVARRGAVVVDLRLFPLLRVGPVASYDGKLSTDQAWCLEEVRQITANMPVEELRRRFPFRFTMVLRTNETP